MSVRYAALAPGVWIALATASAGCGPKEEAPPPRAVSITLERTPCFGPCPVYRVEVGGTGKVVYDGRGFVEERGRWERTVPASEVQELAREIEAAGYFSLRDNYPAEATDHATVITSVTIDGKTKRIEHDLSSRTAPAALEKLYERIGQVAGTKEWVGDPVPRPGEKGGGPDTGRRDTTPR
jgi:hypothetical protein